MFSDWVARRYWVLQWTSRSLRRESYSSKLINVQRAMWTSILSWIPNGVSRDSPSQVQVLLAFLEPGMWVSGVISNLFRPLEFARENQSIHFYLSFPKSIGFWFCCFVFRYLFWIELSDESYHKRIRSNHFENRRGNLLWEEHRTQNMQQE